MSHFSSQLFYAVQDQIADITKILFYLEIQNKNYVLKDIADKDLFLPPNHSLWYLRN